MHEFEVLANFLLYPPFIWGCSLPQKNFSCANQRWAKRQSLKRPIGAWLILSTCLFFFGCAPTTTRVAFEPIASYNAFVIPKPLVPFEAQGVIQFRVGEERQGGDFLFWGTEGRYQLQLLSPLMGSQIAELRFDPLSILALDYQTNTFILTPNTASNRLRLFSLDLPPADLLLLFTARIHKAHFTAHQGQHTPQGLRFKQGAFVYFFELGTEGLPIFWEKRFQRKVLYRVNYHSYHRDPHTQLRFPRKIAITTPTESEQPVQMRIGIRRFFPGKPPPQPIVLTPPQHSPWQATHLPEEAPPH